MHLVLWLCTFVILVTQQWNTLDLTRQHLNNESEPERGHKKREKTLLSLLKIVFRELSSGSQVGYHFYYLDMFHARLTVLFRREGKSR